MRQKYSGIKKKYRLCQCHFCFNLNEYFICCNSSFETTDNNTFSVILSNRRLYFFCHPERSRRIEKDALHCVPLGVFAKILLRSAAKNLPLRKALIDRETSEIALFVNLSGRRRTNNKRVAQF